MGDPEVGNDRNRAGTSRDEVIDSALALIESDGVDALSMRRLAAVLGVVPTAIYWHVGGRDELLDAVVERFSERLVHHPVTGTTPVERICSTVAGFRRYANEHQNLAHLVHSRGYDAALAHPLQVVLGRELTSAGLTGDHAGQAIRSLLFFVGGFVLLETQYMTQPSLAMELWSHAPLTGVEPGIVEEMQRAPDIDEVFHRTLRVLVEGLLRPVS